MRAIEPRVFEEAAMKRRMPRLLLLAVLSGGLAIIAAAQSPTEPGGSKKADPKAGDSAKGKDKDQTKDKEAAKGKADKAKLPPGSIVIIPNPLDKTFSLWPAFAVLPIEDYQALREQIAALQRQLKSEKTRAHSCDMTAKLEGEHVVLRAEFVFATEEPRATVSLGMKGALADKAEIDGRTPVLDYVDDEGFTVRVDEPGSHRLLLH